MESETTSKGRARAARSFHIGEGIVVASHLGLLFWGALSLASLANFDPSPSWSAALTTWGLLALTVPAAWFVADLCSGLVHFVADNFGSSETPVLGRTFIAPFRQHHEDPEAMVQHGFLERNASSALFSLPLLAWIPVWPPSSAGEAAFGAFCLQLGLWLLVTNEIHAACHRSDAPGWMRWLQRTGLVLPPTQHRTHHETVARTPTPVPRDWSAHLHYCITSGACDRLLVRTLGRLAPFRRASRAP